MDDVLKILLVIGILLFGLARKTKKEAKETPLPENWGDETYGGYIPEGPDSAMEKEEQKPAETPIAPKIAAREGLRTTNTPPPPPMETPAQPEKAPVADVDVHSIEDVRRGVIWSEILQRKY